MRTAASGKMTAAGIIQKKILSNFWVKSKLPRQPWTTGPKLSSLRQIMEAMTGDKEQQYPGQDCQVMGNKSEDSV
jgi:hypothetical protein